MISEQWCLVVLGGKYAIASIAPALGLCFPEYRVPMLNRRSHGVCVSEMPLETEEEETDEETSTDGLDDVEQFLNEDDESDFVLEEDEVREVLAAAWKQKTTKHLKRETTSRVWKAVEIIGDSPVTRKFRAEVKELKLRTKCNRRGNVGHWARECPQESSQSCIGGGRGNQPWKKMGILSR